MAMQFRVTLNARMCDCRSDCNLYACVSSEHYTEYIREARWKPLVCDFTRSCKRYSATLFTTANEIHFDSYTHDLRETSGGDSRLRRGTACTGSSPSIRRPCSPAIRKPCGHELYRSCKKFIHGFVRESENPPNILASHRAKNRFFRHSKSYPGKIFDLLRIIKL